MPYRKPKEDTMLCPWCFSKPCICTPDEAEARRNWTDDEYYEKSKAGWQRASAEIERLRGLEQSVGELNDLLHVHDIVEVIALVKSLGMNRG